jgi:hypothetical protein
MGSVRSSHRWCLAVATLLVAGCGGSTSKTSTHVRTVTVPAPVRTPGSPHGELLSVPAVGRIYGHCHPGDPRRTITFLNDSPATDGIVYRADTGRPRTVSIDPGHTLTLKLAAGQFISHEPADPTSRFPAQTLKTTVPISLDITHGSEPHIYRVNVRFAVAAAIGDTTDCALISSTMSADTYYAGGQPAS